MMVPIRCFTCGFPIAEYWEEYKTRINKGEKPAEILDSLGIKRYCCRRMFISTFEYIDEILQYVKPREEKPQQIIEKEIVEEKPTKKRGRKKKYP